VTSLLALLARHDFYLANAIVFQTQNVFRSKAIQDGAADGRLGVLVRDVLLLFSF